MTITAYTSLLTSAFAKFHGFRESNPALNQSHPMPNVLRTRTGIRQQPLFLYFSSKLARSSICRLREDRVPSRQLYFAASFKKFTCWPFRD
jgi:hypothetical protein